MPDSIILHPAFLFITAGLIVPFLKGRIRKDFILIVPIIGIAQIYQLTPETNLSFRFLNTYSLNMLMVSPLRICFAYVFALLAFLASLFAIHTRRKFEHSAALLYAGGSLGVVFSGDFLTLFIHWELMAIASGAIILLKKNRASLDAGYRYLLVHIAGGALLMSGIIYQVIDTQSIAIATPERGSLAYIFMLIGVSINAAIPPLSAWLPDAYPEASSTGSVYLSAYTTKVAVFVLVLIFHGEPVLIWAGALMALYGVIFATLENDIRRLLSYHILSQVGYMVCGVGLGSELAINGAVAHAYNNILYKSLLFMGTGAIIMATGKRQMTELGGLYKKIPGVFILYMVAGFSISGVPLFNGFISKAMVISASAKHHMPIIETILTLAAIGTFLSTTLKLPYHTFFGEDKNLTIKKIPLSSMIAMACLAALCIFHGIVPSLLQGLLPYPDEIYHAYTRDHIISSLQLLIATMLVFIFLIKQLCGHHAYTWDTDAIYKQLGQGLYYFSKITLNRLGEYIYRQTGFIFNQITFILRNPPVLPRKQTVVVSSIGFGIAFTLLFTTIFISLTF